MSKVKLLFAVYIIIAGCEKATYTKSDLSMLNLKGNIVSFIETEYSANGKPGFQADKGYVITKKEIFFNDKGNKIKEVQNALILSSGYYRLIFYNENNKIIKDNFYDLDSIAIIGNVYSYSEDEKEVICYDELNHCVSSVNIWLNDSSKYKEIIYNKAGTPYKTATFIYNTQGKLIEVQTKLFDGFGKIVKYELDEYDKYSLNTIKHSEFDKDSIQVFDNKYTQSFEYNDQGDVVEVWTVYNNIKDTKITYLYGYDEMDNWITRIEYLNGYSQNYYERTFRYEKY